MREEIKDALQMPQTLAFLKAGINFCCVIEQGEDAERTVFLQDLLQTCAALYATAVSMPDYQETFAAETPEEEYIDLENFVTEEQYEAVRRLLKAKTGEDDEFLSAQHEDMQYSDTPIVCTISEDIADTYQYICDAMKQIQTAERGVMLAAIRECLDGMYDHWGVCVLRSMIALQGAVSKGEGYDDEM